MGTTSMIMMLSNDLIHKGKGVKHTRGVAKALENDVAVDENNYRDSRRLQEFHSGHLRIRFGLAVGVQFAWESLLRIRQMAFDHFIYWQLTSLRDMKPKTDALRQNAPDINPGRAYG